MYCVYNFIILKLIMIKSFSPIFRQWLIVITANLSVIILGLSVGWPSPILIMLKSDNQTILSRPITDEEGSWVASVGALSGLISNFAVGFLIDTIGRKSCIILSFFPHLVSSLLAIFASEVWVLILARVVDGVANSITITVVPTYASEIASKECRGALGSVTQITSAIGMLVIYGIGPFMSYYQLNYVVLSLTVIISIPIWFIPETPYFLYSRGREEESIKTLTYLRGSKTIAYDELKEYKQLKMSKREIFKNKTTLKTLGKVIFLGAFIELIGFNAVMFYMQSVLQSTQTSVKEEIASMVNGFIQLLACCCTILLTDRFGRKPLLVTTLIGMAFGMVGLGIFFKLKENEFPISGFLNFLPLMSMMLVIFCFSAGIGSLFWTLVAELFDGPARAIGMSSSTTVAYTFVFLTTKYFVNVTKIIGTPTTYWVFSVNCVITCLFIAFFIPETKGKTFAEIQKELE